MAFRSGRSTGIRDGSQSNASIESDFSQSQDMHANLKERKFRKGAELEELGNEGGFVRIGESKRECLPVYMAIICTLSVQMTFHLWRTLWTRYWLQEYRIY